jgi:peptidyl-prolyl cis-trans isomerase D
MLQTIRDRATGWIAWAIVILLIIPFALWGIQEYFRGGSEVNVAEVGGVSISRIALDNAVDQALRQTKDRPQGKAMEQLRQSVLNSLIQEEVLVQAAANAGMRVSDAELAQVIRSVPAFQRDGKFDRDLYVRLLRANGLTVEGFEARQKREMLSRQLSSGVVNSAFVTGKELDYVTRLWERKIDLAYLTLPVKRFESGVEIKDEQVANYYDQHHDEFMTPARVKLSYLKLDVKEMEKNVKVTDKELRAQYEEQKASFSVPEQREASHILIAVDDKADKAAVEAAKKKAEDIRKQILAGESFAAMAKKYSDDPGSAGKGGDLGLIDRGTMDKAFEKAVFALPEGEISEPVRTPFGFHIIKVTKIKPAHEKTFEEVRPVLEKDYRRQQAENQFYDQSQTLDDLSYENPTTLDVAAAQLGLQIQETGWITRKGAADGIGSYPAVVAAAFSSDVLAGGDLSHAVNSKMIELKQGAGNSDQVPPVVVIHLKEYERSKLRPLDEVRGQITDKLRAEAARDKAREVAGQWVAKLNGGEDLKALAKENDLKLTEAGYVGRNDAKHDSAIVRAAFKMKKPSGGKAAFESLELPSGDVAVFAVSAVQDGDPAKVSEQTRKFLEQFVTVTTASSEMKDLLDNLRKEADVTIYADQLKPADEN